MRRCSRKLTLRAHTRNWLDLTSAVAPDAHPTRILLTTFFPQVAEVEADLELVVSNALIFNATNDPVHRYALELQAVFRNELQHLKCIIADDHEEGEEGQIDKKPRVR